MQNQYIIHTYLSSITKRAGGASASVIKLSYSGGMANIKRQLISLVSTLLFLRFITQPNSKPIILTNLDNTTDDNTHTAQHYCQHNGDLDNQTKGDCYRILSPVVASKPTWYYLGDSQMNYLVENIQYPYEIHSTRQPDNDHPPWGRCDLLNYYFLEKSTTWNPPATIDYGRGQIQGPTRFGLVKRHWCLDASGPYNRQFATNSKHFMEYLAVEYGSDVEHQSTITNTSQESAVHYMKWQLDNLLLTKDDSICVVNTGIHDQKLCPGLKNEDTCLNVYISNVRSYLKLLNTTCGHILWVSITSVL